MSDWTLAVGDCRAAMGAMEAESVHCVVTSPPYWGLRDYGHEGQLGLERTPAEYVEAMVEVFREVRRVLRPDGVVFLNLGDSYYGSNMTGGTGSMEGSAKREGRLNMRPSRGGRAPEYDSGGTGGSGCLDCDSASENPCDGRTNGDPSRTSGICLRHAAERVHESCLRTLACTAELRGHLPSADCSVPPEQLQSASATLDRLQAAIHECGRVLASLESTQRESARPPRDCTTPDEPSSAFLASLRSFCADAPPFVRRLGAAAGTRNYRAGIASLCEELERHTQCIAGCCSLVLSYRNIPRPEPQRSEFLLKPKDLVGVPWRVAFALQAAGWYLRSDIVWSKPNPMPESVEDRPTKAHEYVFLLSKNERYFYDAEAIAESASQPAGTPALTAQHKSTANGFTKNGTGNSTLGTNQGPATRNARSVWTIATVPYPGAHFATFPSELAEKCILAGTSARGCCPACGAPWRRVVEKEASDWQTRKAAGASKGSQINGHNASHGNGTDHTLGKRRVLAETWKPSCSCDAGEPVPCTVLDPFAGSGTVGMVATGHGRRAVLIELNPAYAPLIRERCGALLEAPSTGNGRHMATVAGDADGRAGGEG